MAMFDLGWARVANPGAPIEPGQIIAMEALTLGLWTLNLSRILETVDNASRFGLLYATTPMHVEQGAERFLLELTQPPARSTTCWKPSRGPAICWRASACPSAAPSSTASPVTLNGECVKRFGPWPTRPLPPPVHSPVDTSYLLRESYCFPFPKLIP